MNTSSYARFGNSNPLTVDDVDPVTQCVGNTFFTKTGIPGENMQKDFCPRFMSQRCATKWDAYCEAFLLSSETDMGGYTHLNKDFLSDVAKKKYCRANLEALGAHCALKCESFNPSGQTSVEICETIGTQNWLDTKAEYDLGGNFPQSARLNPVSPLYMDRCPETCDARDVTSTDALGPDDQVLNRCIQYGGCTPVLMDLAYNVIKNGTKVTNPAFMKLVDAAKLEQPVNPNVVTKIAKSYGVPPEVALDVLKAAQYGVSTAEVAKMPAAITQAASTGIANCAASCTSPGQPQDEACTRNCAESMPGIEKLITATKAVVSPMTNFLNPPPEAQVSKAPGSTCFGARVREGFYPPLKVEEKKVIYGVVGVLILVLLGAAFYYFFMRKSKRY